MNDARAYQHQDGQDRHDDYAVPLPAGASMFMQLVSRGSPREVTRYLSRHPGYDVNAADQLGAIPLVVSASSLNTPMVRCLLDARADPNVRQMDAPGGQTALYAAADGQAIHLEDGWSDMTCSGLEPHPKIDE